MDYNVGCAFTADETYPESLKFPEIRLMNQGATGHWYSAADPTTNATVDGFSATCYFTALHLKLSVPALAAVPIGLVRSSVGGQVRAGRGRGAWRRDAEMNCAAQVIERFMSVEAMEAVGVPAANATNTSCGQSSHTLYDQLIAPLAPFVFKV